MNMSTQRLFKRLTYSKPAQSDISGARAASPVQALFAKLPFELLISTRISKEVMSGQLNL